MKATSLCGLGQGSPNPVFSTLRYFRDEYLAHIDDGACPGGRLPDRSPALAGAVGPGRPQALEAANERRSGGGGK